MAEDRTWYTTRTSYAGFPEFEEKAFTVPEVNVYTWTSATDQIEDFGRIRVWHTKSFIRIWVREDLVDETR